MFFKNIAESVLTVPKYMIDDFLAVSDQIATTTDYRTVLGKENFIQGFGKMSPSLQKVSGQISTYIISMQLPLLKEMVIFESLIVTIPGGKSMTKMPTRYLYRVGELLTVPIRGQLTMTSSEFPGLSITMHPGAVYRINNRIDSQFHASGDFLAACYNMIDFDLRRYLMPHDIGSPYAKAKDEYVDPTQAPPTPEVPADAY